MDTELSGLPLARTLPLQIAERIGLLIVEEKLLPGERLREVGLAENFYVSRATIREALRILEQRNLVSIVPQRGAQVTALSHKELEDLFEIRAVLLGLVSRRVALNHSPEVKTRLDAGYRGLLAKKDDESGYARESADLVKTLTQLCGNQQLADYIDEFALRIGRYARLGLMRSERRIQSLANWRKLLRAIVAHDAEQAEILHRRLSTQNLAAAVVELERRESDEYVEVPKARRASRKSLEKI